MDRNGSKNRGCLIAGTSVLALGVLLLLLDYALVAAHSVPPFCTRPACATMLKFLNISAIGSCVALVCAPLAEIIWPRVLLMAAAGALIVSVVAGFGTGVGLWFIPNAIVMVVLASLLFVRWLDR